MKINSHSESVTNGWTFLKLFHLPSSASLSFTLHTRIWPKKAEYHPSKGKRLSNSVPSSKYSNFLKTSLGLSIKVHIKKRISYQPFGPLRRLPTTRHPYLPIYFANTKPNNLYVIYLFYVIDEKTQHGTQEREKNASLSFVEQCQAKKKKNKHPNSPLICGKNFINCASAARENRHVQMMMKMMRVCVCGVVGSRQRRRHVAQVQPTPWSALLVEIPCASICCCIFCYVSYIAKYAVFGIPRCALIQLNNMKSLLVLPLIGLAMMMRGAERGYLIYI